MEEDYLERVESMFPDTFDEILRLAIAAKLNIQNCAQVFDLEGPEVLALAGIVNYMLRSEYVNNAIDETRELLGDMDDELDEDGDEDLGLHG